MSKKLPPPPPPLTKEEFDKRWAGGARNLEEIHPEFYKWLQERRRQENRKYLIMCVGFVGIISILMAILALTI